MNDTITRKEDDMRLVNLTCPNCTARMRPVSQKVPYVKCEYCDSLFKLEGEQLLSTEVDLNTTEYEKKTERNPYVQEKVPVIKKTPERLEKESFIS